MAAFEQTFTGAVLGTYSVTGSFLSDQITWNPATVAGWQFDRDFRSGNAAMTLRHLGWTRQAGVRITLGTGTGSGGVFRFARAWEVQGTLALSNSVAGAITLPVEDGWDHPSDYSWSPTELDNLNGWSDWFDDYTADGNPRDLTITFAYDPLPKIGAPNDLVDLFGVGEPEHLTIHRPPSYPAMSSAALDLGPADAIQQSGTRWAWTHLAAPFTDPRLSTGVLDSFRMKADRILIDDAGGSQPGFTPLATERGSLILLSPLIGHVEVPLSLLAESGRINPSGVVAGWDDWWTAFSAADDNPLRVWFVLGDLVMAPPSPVADGQRANAAQPLSLGFGVGEVDASRDVELAGLGLSLSTGSPVPLAEAVGNDLSLSTGVGVRTVLGHVVSDEDIFRVDFTDFVGDDSYQDALGLYEVTVRAGGDGLDTLRVSGTQEGTRFSYRDVVSGTATLSASGVGSLSLPYVRGDWVAVGDNIDGHYRFDVVFSGDTPTRRAYREWASSHRDSESVEFSLTLVPGHAQVAMSTGTALPVASILPFGVSAPDLDVIRLAELLPLPFGAVTGPARAVLVGVVQVDVPSVYQAVLTGFVDVGGGAFEVGDFDDVVVLVAPHSVDFFGSGLTLPAVTMAGEVELSNSSGTVVLPGFTTASFASFAPDDMDEEEQALWRDWIEASLASPDDLRVDIRVGRPQRVHMEVGQPLPLAVLDAAPLGLSVGFPKGFVSSVGASGTGFGLSTGSVVRTVIADAVVSGNSYGATFTQRIGPGVYRDSGDYYEIVFEVNDPEIPGSEDRIRFYGIQPATAFTYLSAVPGALTLQIDPITYDHGDWVRREDEGDYALSLLVGGDSGLVENYRLFVSFWEGSGSWNFPADISPDRYRAALSPGSPVPLASVTSLPFTLSLSEIAEPFVHELAPLELVFGTGPVRIVRVGMILTVPESVYSGPLTGFRTLTDTESGDPLGFVVGAADARVTAVETRVLIQGDDLLDLVTNSMDGEVELSNSSGTVTLPVRVTTFGADIRLDEVSEGDAAKYASWFASTLAAMDDSLFMDLRKGRAQAVALAGERPQSLALLDALPLGFAAGELARTLFGKPEPLPLGLTTGPARGYIPKVAALPLPVGLSTGSPQRHSFFEALPFGLSISPVEGLVPSVSLTSLTVGLAQGDPQAYSFVEALPFGLSISPVEGIKPSVSLMPLPAGLSQGDPQAYSFAEALSFGLSIPVARGYLPKVASLPLPAGLSQGDPQAYSFAEALSFGLSIPVARGYLPKVASLPLPAGLSQGDPQAYSFAEALPLGLPSPVARGYLPKVAARPLPAVLSTSMADGERVREGETRTLAFGMATPSLVGRIPRVAARPLEASLRTGRPLPMASLRASAWGLPPTRPRGYLPTVAGEALPLSFSAGFPVPFAQALPLRIGAALGRPRGYLPTVAGIALRWAAAASDAVAYVFGRPLTLPVGIAVGELGKRTVGRPEPLSVGMSLGSAAGERRRFGSLLPVSLGLSSPVARGYLPKVASRPLPAAFGVGSPSATLFSDASPLTLSASVGEPYPYPVVSGLPAVLRTSMSRGVRTSVSLLPLRAGLTQGDPYGLSFAEGLPLGLGLSRPRGVRASVALRPLRLGIEQSAIQGLSVVDGTPLRYSLRSPVAKGIRPTLALQPLPAAFGAGAPAATLFASAAPLALSASTGRPYSYPVISGSSVAFSTSMSRGVRTSVSLLPLSAGFGTAPLHGLFSLNALPLGLGLSRPRGIRPNVAVRGRAFAVIAGNPHALSHAVEEVVSLSSGRPSAYLRSVAASPLDLGLSGEDPVGVVQAVLVEGGWSVRAGHPIPFILHRRNAGEEAKAAQVSGVDHSAEVSGLILDGEVSKVAVTFEVRKINLAA